MAGVGKRLNLNFGRSRARKAKQSPESRDELDYELSGYRKGSGGGINMPNMLGVPPVKTSKSGSLGSLTSNSMDSALNHDDIMSLTHDVRNFSEALAKLKVVFSETAKTSPEYDIRVVAHEKLGEVLCILKNVLQKYPALHTTDVLTAAAILITKIKSSHYEEAGCDTSELHYSIDQLALAFSSSVSEYLMGDIETFPSLGKTKSYDNLASGDSDLIGPDDSGDRDTVSLGPDELDHVLVKLDQGVDIALQRAKLLSKYTKDIITYVEKRSSLENEYTKNLAKLAASARHIITEDSYLPFQSIYCTACDQDMEYASNCQATCSIIQTHKFIEPLTNMRLDHDRIRKNLKDSWTREVRKMHDCVNNLRKARTLYITRQQEYEKAKDVALKAESEIIGQSTAGTKAEKKKRLEEDAMHKAIEAETTYKACVAEANHRRHELDRVKADVLSQIRELIYEGDQTLKTATVSYFQLQHHISAAAPVQYQALCESSDQYEPGAQYAEYVRHIPIPSASHSHLDSYVFEPYAPDNKAYDRKPSTQSSGSGSSDAHLYGYESPSQSPDSGKGPRKGWRDKPDVGSDTDSISESSSRSRESSPSASPYSQQRRMITSSSMNELAEADRDAQFDHRLVGVSVSAEASNTFRGVVLSRAAKTHVFKKLRTPSRCRECESYVYFQGAECEKCGLSSHKKCLESLHWECGHKPQDRRMTTFGVDFTAHVRETHTEIPHLIKKCTREIEHRGLHCKGIYRVSGVKSRVEKLCQSFETEEGRVDLSDHHPNVIANVLKLYLRQLPEPLLTFRLYYDLINLAKDEQAAEQIDEAATVQKLKSLIMTLPKPNMRTCKRLMHHLKRVTEEAEVNQMTARNLGIVFGPTLLRPSEGAASLHSLMDTPYQSRVIELLINQVQVIFGQEEKEIWEQHDADQKKIDRLTPVQILAPNDDGKDLFAGVNAVKTAEFKREASPGETRWFVPEITENLLDELAKEEPRFQQAAEEFVILPGSLESGTQPVPQSQKKTTAPPSDSLGVDDVDGRSDPLNAQETADVVGESARRFRTTVSVNQLLDSLLPDYFKSPDPCVQTGTVLVMSNLELGGGTSPYTLLTSFPPTPPSSQPTCTSNADSTSLTNTLRPDGLGEGNPQSTSASEMLDSLLPDYFKTKDPRKVRTACPYLSSRTGCGTGASPDSLLTSVPSPPASRPTSKAASTSNTNIMSGVHHEGTPTGRAMSLGAVASSPGLRRKLLAKDLRRNSSEEEEVIKVPASRVASILARPKQFSPVPLRRTSSKPLEGGVSRSTFYAASVSSLGDGGNISPSCNVTESSDRHPSAELKNKLTRKLSAPEEREPTYV